MKINFKYIVILSTGCLILLFLELITPEPVDWSLNFSRKSKIPFGNYVLYNLLPEIFPENIITEVSTPIYNHLKNKEITNTNYIIINDVFSPDKLDTQTLLNYVSAGNHAFIAAVKFSKKFADTLKIKTNFNVIAFDDTFATKFINPNLTSEGMYKFKAKLPPLYFTSFDTLHTSIIGTTDKNEINFIKIKFGQGIIFLCTIPIAFTNYYVLDNVQSDFLFKALSLLPVQQTFWDEYYKIGRRIITTPLRYILTRQPLKWAYGLTMISIFLYIFFKGKRKQRIIPKYKHLTNTTLEFVETVGNLYYQHGSHKNIAEKKISYFLEFIRSHFYLDTNKYSHEFIQTLSNKAGIDIQDINKLITAIQTIQLKVEISEQELLDLSTQIENFYKSVHLKNERLTP